MRVQPPLPRTLMGVLAALLLRPRLAGAETYVTRLVGTLTLPPRRLAPQELPVGGYADMTTRGAVEHILPSQHALDELEFLRRFAERELLFFRREEPPAQNRQEIAILIDQGVRTWGDVRLVLAAAALALGKQCAGRAQQFRFAGTSNAGRLLDPLEADVETLGELIEASDLSFDPGTALEAVLEQPCDALRDVVLLTHPRNLREPDVLAAAHRAGKRDRVFAVALDEEGTAAMSEIRHGAPVLLRQFRVEFVAAQPCRPSLRRRNRSSRLRRGRATWSRSRVPSALARAAASRISSSITAGNGCSRSVPATCYTCGDCMATTARCCRGRSLKGICCATFRRWSA